MKIKLTLTLLVALIAIVCIAIMINNKTGKTEAIEISKHSTQFYLDSLTTALDKKGIVLKLDTIGFNDKGNLQIISGEINFSTGCQGTFSTDNLEKIMISKNNGQLLIKVN